MQRLTIFCLCVSLASASPFTRQKIDNKKVFLKDLGTRIVNGQQASLGQIPWQAALIATGDDDDSWFCGGSIISPEWILTAGHCVSGARSGDVYTGLVDLTGEVGTATSARTFVLHEGYNPDNLENDIGLVRLSSFLPLNANTAVISLSTYELIPNVPVQVSGWGLTRDGGSNVSLNLNYVDLVTVSDFECSLYYGTIASGVVCATSIDTQVRTPCSGDSGGPLVVNPKSQPVLVAVVSFVSSAGCITNAPSGYTRTQYHRDWIRQNTGV